MLFSNDLLELMSCLFFFLFGARKAFPCGRKNGTHQWIMEPDQYLWNKLHSSKVWNCQRKKMIIIIIILKTDSDHQVVSLHLRWELIHIIIAICNKKDYKTNQENTKLQCIANNYIILFIQIRISFPVV